MRKFSHHVDALRHESKLGHIRHRQSPLWTRPTAGSRDRRPSSGRETGCATSAPFHSVRRFIGHPLVLLDVDPLLGCTCLDEMVCAENHASTRRPCSLTLETPSRNSSAFRRWVSSEDIRVLITRHLLKHRDDEGEPVKRKILPRVAVKGRT